MYKDYLSLSQAGGPLHQRHLSSVTNHGQVVAVGGTWIAPQAGCFEALNWSSFSELKAASLHVLQKCESECVCHVLFWVEALRI